jgi:short-subunit dehydrogenase
MNAHTAGGAEYAHGFANREHAVILVARDSARIQHLARRLRREAGVTVDILRADLNDDWDRALVETRLQQDDRIGVVVNNAGMTFMVAFSRTWDEAPIDQQP